MANFDEVVAAATRRLGLDRELQLEVARELRGHLEDSAAEYVAAGYSPQAADDEAAKHLGDPSQLADDLWLANRWRLRVRAVAKWAAQVALVPAAVLVAVVALQGPWTTIGTTYAVLRWVSNVPSRHSWRLDFTRREVAGLTAEQRWVLLGDPAVKTPLEKARSIVERWPDDPIYYGDYANQAAVEVLQQVRKDPKAETASWYLPILERGERLEPDNGYYNLCRATTYLDRAGELDVSGPAAAKYPQSAPAFEPSVLTLRDAGAMEEALAELHKAVAKPKITSHAVEMAQLRLGMLPPPKTVLEYLHRQFFTLGVLLPDLGGVRKLARTASAYAWVLAQAGELERARGILHDVSLLGTRQAVDGDCLIRVLVGQAIAQMAGEYGQYIAERHGTAEGAAEAAAENRAMREVFEGIRTKKNARFDYFRRAGVLYRAFLPAVPEYEPEPGPVRRAEQAVVQSAGFGAMLLVGSVLLVPAAGVGLWVSLRRRASRAAPMVFVGWRRLGWVVLWGTVAPLAVYAAYIVSPLSNREFGWGYMPERFVVEWLAVAVGMVAVLKPLVRRAVQQKAAELGVKGPQKPMRRWWWARLAALTLLGLAVVTYIALWQFEGLRPHGSFFLPGGMESNQPLFLFAMGLIVVVAVGLVVGIVGSAVRFALLWRRNREMALIAVRSGVPILAAVVLVLAVVSRAAFSLAEARALAPIKGAGDLTLFNEVQGSAYRELVAFHARRLERLQDSAAAPPADR